MDKPKCFGKYKATFPKQGRVCRTCPFAVQCKVIEPKKGRPKKAEDETSKEVEKE